MTPPGQRLLVVSHPAVLPANQGVYDALSQRGWDVHLVVPARWRHEYATGSFPPAFLPTLAPNAMPLPTMVPGQPQRHFHLALPGRLLDRVRPDAVFLEQEPVALVTGQWIGALRRRKIPFLLQQDENLDRHQPWIARVIRKASLSRASAVAARSPRAAELVQQLRPGIAAPVIPHAIVDWPDPGPRAMREPGDRLRVGYAGRLIEAKGILDLIAATDRAEHPMQLTFFGNGELLEVCRAASTERRPVHVVTDLDHSRMDAAYRAMDVLVLPSRTTATWAEQFGRVLVEAMALGCPVIGSDSGEIPWVIATGGGGLTFREGDVDELAVTLDRLAAEPSLLVQLGAQGSAGFSQYFSLKAVTDATEAAIFDSLGRKP